MLAAELSVFLLVTVALAAFLSHAGAERFQDSDAVPPNFPVLVFDGDRARPRPGDYSVVAWSEWPALRDRRPMASLLPPEPAGDFALPDGARARFRMSVESDARPQVELWWTSGERERHTVYLAGETEISPRYARSTTTSNFLIAAIVGFLAGLATGRFLRRRYLAAG